MLYGLWGESGGGVKLRPSVLQEEHPANRSSLVPDTCTPKHPSSVKENPMAGPASARKYTGNIHMEENQNPGSRLMTANVAVISAPDRNTLQGGRFIWAPSCKGAQSITGKGCWSSLVHGRDTADQERARAVGGASGDNFQSLTPMT